MFKKRLLILFTFLLIGCSSAPLIKVTWDGDLVKTEEDINYLYWREGVQILAQHKDSVAASFAGFSHENYIYILVSITNDTERPITYFPSKSSILYKSGKKNIELKPIKPKNLDKDHFSFFNTVIAGAGSISRLFINLPVDMLLPDTRNENPISDIGQDYHDEDIRITKKIFVSTHTIRPEVQFAGFLVYEYDDDLEPNNAQFTFKLDFDEKEFLGTAKFD